LVQTAPAKKILTGITKADQGQVFFQGTDITRLRTFERCRCGIARSSQIPHPFAGMSVFENLLVGAARRRKAQVGPDRGLKRLYRLESTVGRDTSRPISAATYKTLTCAIARNCSLGAALASDGGASGHASVCEELFQLWVERLIHLVPRSKTSVKVQKTLAGRHESDLVGRRQAQLYPAEKTDQAGHGDDDQGIGPGENKDQRAKAGQQKSSPVVVS